MDTSGELTCRELVELVTDYVEGGLAPKVRMRFEEHLLICEACSAYIDQLRNTIPVPLLLPHTWNSGDRTRPRWSGGRADQPR